MPRGWNRQFSTWTFALTARIFDRFVNRAKDEYGIRYIRSMPSVIKEMQQTNNLVMKYVNQDGTLNEEEFDMVVLSVGLMPPKEAKETGPPAWGIDLEEHGFCKTQLGKSCSRHHAPAFFVCGAFGGPKDIPETVMEASAAAACAEGLLASRRGYHDYSGGQIPEENGYARQGSAHRRVCLPLRYQYRWCC